MRKNAMPSAVVYLWIPAFDIGNGNAAIHVFPKQNPPVHLNWWNNAGQNRRPFTPDIDAPEKYSTQTILHNLDCERMYSEIRRMKVHGEQREGNSCSLVYRVLREGGAPKAQFGLRLKNAFFGCRHMDSIWTAERLSIYMKSLYAGNSVLSNYENYSDPSAAKLSDL
jgi:hypothetical protein